MIYKKINSTQYRSEFIDKFTSFGEKAPIMLSFATDELGVTVVHENSNQTYFYPWDYTIPVKIFIHNIKDELSKNHYPRVSRLESVVHNFTPEEQADMIANGVSVDSVPVSKTETKTVTYRIDKILASLGNISSKATFKSSSCDNMFPNEVSTPLGAPVVPDV